MPIIAVVGSQWGDEGKGRVVDYLASRVDIVARYQGGDNAGHTVVVGNETFKFHLIPSGVVSGKLSILGNGMVINPFKLVKEIESLEARGIKPNIIISDRAHMILPYHQLLDGLQERIKGNLAAGTTKRGIGPTYADKMDRIGIRMVDLKDFSELKKKLELLFNYKLPIFEKYNIECPTPDEVLAKLEKIKELIEKKEVLTLKPFSATRGGLLFNLFGTQGFLPISKIKEERIEIKILHKFPVKRQSIEEISLNQDFLY